MPVAADTKGANSLPRARLLQIASYEFLGDSGMVSRTGAAPRRHYRFAQSALHGICAAEPN